jgi:hypothetical protein
LLVVVEEEIQLRVAGGAGGYRTGNLSITPGPYTITDWLGEDLDLA